MENTMPTVYVSGKATTSNEQLGSETVVETILRRLSELGILPVYDWTQADVQKPYLTFDDRNRPAAEAMLRAIQEADIFVLVMGGEVYGAIGEFVGYCTSHVVLHRHAYVLGHPEQFRQSLFMCLPGVKIVQTIDELIVDIEQLVK